jgi:hypothetical protein
MPEGSGTIPCRSSCPYSPKCVEGEFSEVELPLYGVPEVERLRRVGTHSHGKGLGLMVDLDSIGVSSNWTMLQPLRNHPS